MPTTLDDNDEWLTTPQAAELTGMTNWSIRRAIVTKRLHGVTRKRGLHQIEHVTRLSDLRAWMARRRRGRKPAIKAPQEPTVTVGKKDAPLLAQWEVDREGDRRLLFAKAKRGDKQAIRTLSLPWEQGGYGFSELVLDRVRVI